MPSHQIADETLSHVTPLMRKHINPFGRYHFDLTRMRQDLGNSPQGIFNGGFRLDVLSTRLSDADSTAGGD